MKATSRIPETIKATIFSLMQIGGAAAVYWHLVTGGWLTEDYHWNDLNIVNLILAIFEPVALMIVLAYWIWRTERLYRILYRMFLVQVIIGAGFLLVFVAFAMLWHPRMM